MYFRGYVISSSTERVNPRLIGRILCGAVVKPEPSTKGERELVGEDGDDDREDSIRKRSQSFRPGQSLRHLFLRPINPRISIREVTLREIPLSNASKWLQCVREEEDM